MNNLKKEIIITGFGGQGIILAGKIVGMASALYDNKESTFVQSYGPESRGGFCSAQVVISDKTIDYPYIKKPDILVCMSQGGYDKFIYNLKEDGTLIIDSDLVKSNIQREEYFSIPATRIAEEMGRKMMANIIMVGFVTSVTHVVSLEAAKKTVLESVPKGTEKLNTEAFIKGYDYGMATLKSREKKASGNIGA
ncbi:MAG: 2-oxoacid:acceptor oxidoreductase family protein [Desulfobacterales bacterium]|nr:2-oxoacid:acceptor oxidoreductase family protein [Desulfobacterales bacterium]MBF0395675.1 2-oxoacid:acceptor oxidoreductase family protein [Desulfobacterales bacterium]